MLTESQKVAYMMLDSELAVSELLVMKAHLDEDEQLRYYAHGFQDGLASAMEIVHKGVLEHFKGKKRNPQNYLRFDRLLELRGHQFVQVKKLR